MKSFHVQGLAMKCFFKYCLLIILLTILFGTGCKKNNNPDSALPPLTFEGKNTIGCKINGMPWVPRGISGGGVYIYPTKGGYLGVHNSPLVHIWITTNDPMAMIDIFVRNYDNYKFLRPGIYQCNKNTPSLPAAGVAITHTYGIYHANGRDYITDSLHTGWIEILKSDSLSGIISGRFQFDAYSSIEGKAYQIREGRFDYKTH